MMHIMQLYNEQKIEGGPKNFEISSITWHWPWNYRYLMQKKEKKERKKEDLFLPEYSNTDSRNLSIRIFSIGEKGVSVALPLLLGR